MEPEKEIGFGTVQIIRATVALILIEKQSVFLFIIAWKSKVFPKLRCFSENESRQNIVVKTAEIKTFSYQTLMYNKTFLYTYLVEKEEKFNMFKRFMTEYRRMLTSMRMYYQGRNQL